MNKLKIALFTVGLMVASAAGAALLNTYVAATGTANVTQAITWGNGDIGNRDYSITGAGGCTYEFSHGNLKNNADSPVLVEFNTSAADGITVTYKLDGVAVVGNTAEIPTHFYGDFTSVITFANDIEAKTYTISTSVNPSSLL